MGKKSFNFRLKHLWQTLRSQRSSGFTLTELLVVMIIAGGIVSGLMYLVVELQGTDQRESARTETQREMQLALDYMSSELREAVYIYDGICMRGQGAPGSDGYCPGVVNHIPANISANGIPILAFWKQQRLPPAIQAACASGTAPERTPCVTGHSYALVVYSLNTANVGGTWNGRARITRYALTQFNRNGVANPSYVALAEVQNNFRQWPIGDGGVNLQLGRQPTDAPDVLVDFVDDGAGIRDSAVQAWTTEAQACPVGYLLTFDSTRLIGALADAKSFYGCVRDGTSSRNRDVILYLRGNANGRPGVRSNATFLPTLETRVMSRVVMDKDPGQ